LRLQLEGDLGDDLKLQAAITDETIPIQPDGTTQQINDFDKVFIQLIRKDDKVILGDFEIDHKGTQFANFYRNVQGIGFRVEGDKKGYAGINGAVAKGKFQTNSFIGREGFKDLTASPAAMANASSSCLPAAKRSISTVP
jgi:hypothetical protein